MHIKEILDQIRRDFTAIYECEHCGHEEKKGGYDDDNFHQNVIPKMKCPSCGETANQEKYEAEKTRYPEGFQI